MSMLKTRTREVRITRSEVAVDGCGFVNKPVGNIQIASEWRLTIPITSVTNMQYQSFKADGCTHFHKKAIGISTSVNGVEWNYGILTKDSEALFKAIEVQMKAP